ncbi:hypothetical protein [Clostridium argentinense]|nr:hypothetical protein [Clostridium argentinense]
MCRTLFAAIESILNFSAVAVKFPQLSIACCQFSIVEGVEFNTEKYP